MNKRMIEVEVERIRPNLRLIYVSETIDFVTRCIAFRGEVEPLEIWFDGEGFRIWDGEKRWRACKRLGINRVKALLVEFN